MSNSAKTLPNPKLLLNVDVESVRVLDNADWPMPAGTVLVTTKSHGVIYIMGDSVKAEPKSIIALYDEEVFRQQLSAELSPEARGVLTDLSDMAKSFQRKLSLLNAMTHSTKEDTPANPPLSPDAIKTAIDAVTGYSRSSKPTPPLSDTIRKTQSNIESYREHMPPRFSLSLESPEDSDVCPDPMPVMSEDCQS